MPNANLPDLQVSREEGYFIITCALLDVVGTGATLSKAKQSFAEEFAFVRERYSRLPDSELTQRLQTVKATLNAIG